MEHSSTAMEYWRQWSKKIYCQYTLAVAYMGQILQLSQQIGYQRYTTPPLSKYDRPLVVYKFVWDVSYYAYFWKLKLINDSVLIILLIAMFL